MLLENKKIIGDIDNYNLSDHNYNDLNKTVDMIIQNGIKNYKNDISLYGNNSNDKTGNKMQSQEQKQKPAAPEIKKKVVNPLGNINICLSDSNMPQYSNVSSVKSFKRPKSMERLKRKSTNKNKNSKGKIK